MCYICSEKSYLSKNVTPDEASFILQNYNKNNRNIDQIRVNMIAEDMKNGNFKDNGDVFRFDINGNLLDGQHRLAAIVKSQKTLENATFVMGLNPDVMDTIDRGRKRTNGDVAKLLGYSNSYNLAAMAVLHAQYDRGDFLFHTQVSGNDFERYLKHYNEIYTYGLGVQRRMMSNGFKVASWFGVILALCYQYDAKRTDELAEGLITGGNLNTKDPRLLFRNYMYKTVVRLDNYTRPYFVQTLIKTVNKYFNGETVQDISFRPSVESVKELFFTNVLTKEQAKSISDTFKKRSEKRARTKEKAI